MSVLDTISLAAASRPAGGGFSQSGDMILATGGGSIDMTKAPKWTPFTVKFDSSTITIARTIGIVFFLVWVIYAIAKFASPKGQAGGSLIQRIGGLVPMLAGVISLVALFDLSKTVDVGNLLARLANTILGGFLGAVGK